MLRVAVALIGPPGVGKTKPREALIALEYKPFITGSLLRADPALKAKIEAGELIDDDTVNSAVNRLITPTDASEKVVLDGYLRTTSQMIYFRRRIRELRAKLIVVHLQASLETCQQRIMSRNDEGRPEDDLEKHRRRYKDYLEVTVPAVAHLRNFTDKALLTLRTDDMLIEEVTKAVVQFVSEQTL